MAKIMFGLNNCWAVKRWPLPEEWAEITRSLDIDIVQVSFDLFEPMLGNVGADILAERTREAVAKYGIKVHSTFTGLIMYSVNLLSHPDQFMRMAGVNWYFRGVELTRKMNVRITGGAIGAMSVYDYRNPERKQFIVSNLFENVRKIAEYAYYNNIEMLLWEPMPVPREIPWSIEETKYVLREVNKNSKIPVKLNIDLGHQCTLQGIEKDPYYWLQELAPESPSLHIQQTDGQGDRHWPFTEEYNKIGIIKAERVIEAIEKSGAKEVYLFLEYIPAPEYPDDKVLEDLKISVKYWKQYL
ncbi:MAG: hypothetical protein QXU13_06845 [Desulfurococcaceae archaeon]